MTSLGLFYKKMVKMQSPRVQCCLCVCCVMSAVLGMSMLSVGVCLVLNYNLLDVDTSGLPPNLHNDEGKKVVGIILTCMGVMSVIISGVISTLYFTVCTRRSPNTSVSPHDGSTASPRDAEDRESGAQDRPASDRGAQGRPSSDRPSHSRPSSREGHGPSSSHLHLHPHYKHLQGNGSTPGRNSPILSGSRRAVPYGRSVSDPMNRSLVSLGKDGPGFSRTGMMPRSHPSPTPSRSHRRGKKGRHPQGRRYKNPLAPHPEEAGADSQSLSESRRSASSSRRLQGQVNHGAELDDDLEMTQGSLASEGSSGSSSVNRAVLIKVDSPHGPGEASPSRRHPDPGEQETELTADTYHTTTYDKHRPRRNLDDDDDDDEDVDDDDEDDGDEDESGRMSRSTLGSQELLDEVSEEPQAAKKRLDNQIQELLS